MQVESLVCMATDCCLFQVRSMDGRPCYVVTDSRANRKLDLVVLVVSVISHLDAT